WSRTPSPSSKRATESASSTESIAATRIAAPRTAAVASSPTCPSLSGRPVRTLGTMAAALAARALTKRYGKVEALRGVDLAVEEGELVGLLGPNGAGKSTLVKIACGLVRPSRGRAEVTGARAGSRAA